MQVAAEEEDRVASMKEKGAWRALGLVAAVLAASVTRKALDSAYKSVRGSDPPANPASPETTWGEAVMWAALTGVAIAVARMVAARGAAAGWRRATGSLPPGLENSTP